MSHVAQSNDAHRLQTSDMCRLGGEDGDRLETSAKEVASVFENTSARELATRVALAVTTCRPRSKLVVCSSCFASPCPATTLASQLRLHTNDDGRFISSDGETSYASDLGRSDISDDDRLRARDNGQGRLLRRSTDQPTHTCTTLGKNAHRPSAPLPRFRRVPR